MQTIHETLKLRITFTEPLLATCPGNKEILEEFIASKAETASQAKEEIDATAVAANVEKVSTVFAREDGRCFIWDYQLKGYLKEAIRNLVELGRGPAGLSPWGVGRAINSFVFVHPRRNFLRQPDGEPLTQPLTLQRPLRAETLQGPRVCLARSEMAPIGTTVEFEVRWLQSLGRKKKNGEAAKTSYAVFDKESITNALAYGEWVGAGQWRGSGSYGRFTWVEL